MEKTDLHHARRRLLRRPHVARARRGYQLSEVRRLGNLRARPRSGGVRPARPPGESVLINFDSARTSAVPSQAVPMVNTASFGYKIGRGGLPYYVQEIVDKVSLYAFPKTVGRIGQFYLRDGIRSFN